MVWVALRVASGLVLRVEGDSMAPTLVPGDRVLALPRRRGDVPRGAVVVVADPRRPWRATVKRVVALAGEVADLGGEPDVVPPGHVAVAGDHRARSTDSRHYGPVPLALVRARVRWRLPGGSASAQVDRRGWPRTLDDHRTSGGERR